MKINKHIFFAICIGAFFGMLNIVYSDSDFKNIPLNCEMPGKFKDVQKVKCKNGKSFYDISGIGIGLDNSLICSNPTLESAILATRDNVRCDRIRKTKSGKKCNFVRRYTIRIPGVTDKRKNLLSRPKFVRCEVCLSNKRNAQELNKAIEQCIRKKTGVKKIKIKQPESQKCPPGQIRISGSSRCVMALPYQHVTSRFCLRNPASCKRASIETNEDLKTSKTPTREKKTGGLGAGSQDKQPEPSDAMTAQNEVAQQSVTSAKRGAGRGSGPSARSISNSRGASQSPQSGSGAKSAGASAKNTQTSSGRQAKSPAGQPVPGNNTAGASGARTTSVILPQRNPNKNLTPDLLPLRKPVPLLQRKPNTLTTPNPSSQRKSIPLPQRNPFKNRTPSKKDGNTKVNTTPPYIPVYGSGGYSQSYGSGGSSGSGGGGFGGIFGSLGQLFAQMRNQDTKGSAYRPPAPPRPQCRLFSASSQTVRQGETATLNYALAYADYAEISGIGSVQPRSGRVTVSPQKSTDYILQAQNQYGSTSCAPVRITVLPAITNETGNNNTKPMMSCSPGNIAPGGTALVLWQCPSQSAYSRGASTEYGVFNTQGKISGSTKVRLNQSSTFVVRCYDTRKNEIGRNSCTVNTQRQLQDLQEYANTNNVRAGSYIRANKTRVNAGDTITIEWEGNNTQNCTITGPDGFKEFGNKGSVTGRILQTSTFTVSCNGATGPLPKKSITITAI